MSTCFIAIVDDHTLFRSGLTSLINSSDGFKVSFQAKDGQDFIDLLQPRSLPDIVLMDINMPRKDGYDTTAWLRVNYPEIKVLALSMYDNELSIIRMIRNGARGYLLKDAEPSELRRALTEVFQKGFYYSELVSGHLLNTIQQLDSKPLFSLNPREIEFLKLCARGLSYQDISEQMHLSPRTIEGYRDNLFHRFDLGSKVSLVIFAIRNGIVDVNDL